MSFIQKINTCLKAFKNINDYKKMYHNFIFIFRSGGIKSVKSKIIEVANRNNTDISKQQQVVTGESNYKNRETDNQIFYEQQAELSIQEMTVAISNFRTKPLISIIMPVYNVKIKWLVKALDSIKKQVYENWELCAVDDCSTNDKIRELLHSYSMQDNRIKIHFSNKNEGISKTSNKALSIAEGEYIALIDNDDEITPDAFFWVAKEIDQNPEVDFIYSDECKIDDSSKESMFEFAFKPDWSPETLMGFMYTGHLTIYKTEVVKSIGGFRSEYDTAQDYDLALRMAEKAKCIRHIERLLYKWRAIEGSVAKGGKPQCVYAGANAGSEILERKGLSHITMLRPYGNYYRVVMEYSPLVSIIIPSDNENRIIPMIHNLIQRTTYSNYEIIVVCNSQVSAQLKEEFSYLSSLKICIYDKVYNFSDKCNKGAEMSCGKFLVFCQDKLLFPQTEWLNGIVELLITSKDIGAVSPKVIRGDNTIQYAGMITGTIDLIGIPYNGHQKESYDEYWTRHRWIRNISVLSATCLAIKRDIFYEIEGFDSQNTPDKFSNADFSFKVQEKEYRCVYTPHSEILNANGNWWDSWFKNEIAYNCHAYMLKKWSKYFIKDPYFTDSMKKAIIKELPYEYKIFYQSVNKVDSLSKNVLLVVYDLSLTGTPIAVHQAAKVLLSSGYFPVIVSSKDGPLRTEIVNDGIMTIIDPYVLHKDLFLLFAKSFDLVMVNSAVIYDCIYTLIDTNIPVIWWIHESEISYKRAFAELIPKHLSANIQVYCGGEYAKRVLLKYRCNYNPSMLLYGINDYANEFQNNSCEENIFTIIGTIEYRKGQDIFVKAIEIMPDNIREKCKFIFVGKEYEQDIYLKVLECKERFSSQIIIIEELSRSELLPIYANSTAIVCSSRDDPMPIVMTESMMLSKICICSENTGTASLITDGVNGFVFKNEDSHDLLNKMLYIINNKDSLNKLEIGSRGIYENHFKMEQFSENLISIVNENVKDNKRYE